MNTRRVTHGGPEPHGPEPPVPLDPDVPEDPDDPAEPDPVPTHPVEVPWLPSR